MAKAIKIWDGTTWQDLAVLAGNSASLSANTFTGNQSITTSSGTALEIIADNATTSEGLTINRSREVAAILLRRNNGIYASPTAILSGERFAGVIGSTHDGTSYSNNAAITMWASENQTSLTRGSYLSFETTVTGTVGRTEKMRIDPSGNLLVGLIDTGSVAYGGKIILQSSAGTQSSMFIRQAGIGSGHIGFAPNSSNIKLVNTYADGLIANGKGLEIDTNGNVLINTTSPSARLTSLAASGGSPLYLGMVATDTTNWIQAKIVRNGYSQQAAWLYVPSTTNSSNPVWYTGLNADSPNFVISTYDGTTFAERMHISPTGNLGVNASSPSYKLQVNALSASSTVDSLCIQNSGVSALGHISGIRFRYISAEPAAIRAILTDASSGAGSLGIFTSPDGTGASLTERMRVDSNGYLLVGYSSSNGAYRLQVNSQIFATSSTIATSDGRYKENVTSLSSGLNIVNSLNPVSFNWKKHDIHNFPEGKTIGFIAQEVQEALSEYEWIDNLIKSNINEEAEEEFLGIAEGNLIPILVAAIKELNEKFELLKLEVRG